MTEDSLMKSMNPASILGKVSEGVDCDIRKLLYAISDRAKRTSGIIISKYRGDFYYKLVPINEGDWKIITEDSEFYWNAVEYLYENIYFDEEQKSYVEEILSGNVTYKKYLSNSILAKVVDKAIILQEHAICFRVLWEGDIDTSRVVLCFLGDLLKKDKDMLNLIPDIFRPVPTPSNLFTLAESLKDGFAIFLDKESNEYKIMKVVTESTFLDDEEGSAMLNVFNLKYSESLYDSVDDNLEYFADELIEKLDLLQGTINRDMYKNDEYYRGFVNLYLGWDDYICIYKNADSELKFSYLCKK